MLDSIFKAYDVRGVYPDQLDDDLAQRIGAGCGRFFKEQGAGPVVVGRDMRKSSPTLAARLTRGLTDAGLDVIDVGRVDTPFVTFAINHLDAIGGVMVTASHNPPQYNGFKISGAQARPVGASTGLNTIKEYAAQGNPSRGGDGGGIGGGGKVSQRDLWSAYRGHALRLIDSAALKNRPVCVVVDASNGMAGTMLPRVFKNDDGAVEGLEIIELNFDNESGVFAHEPNPLVAANMRDLQNAVKEQGADVGVCFDGDADRCVLVDEHSEIIGCDLLTAWLATEFLQKSPGASVVYDLRSSKAVEENVRAAGGEPIRGRVGHVFMKQALREHDGVFGGELSGHFYFRDNFYADSGVMAFAAVVSALARSGKAISEIIASIGCYFQSGEINFETADKDAALDAVKNRYAPVGSIDELDGVTVDCFARDGWWANIRKSNTEPLLRLNLEAKTPQLAGAMIEEISTMLGQRVDH